jgi:hypothetical protein
VLRFVLKIVHHALMPLDQRRQRKNFEAVVVRSEQPAPPRFLIETFEIVTLEN